MEKHETNQKHGIPALISFFLPGVGQLIKGHIGKFFRIWFFYLVGVCLIYILAKEGYLVGTAAGIIYIISVLLSFILWIWNIYDAYNAN